MYSNIRRDTSVVVIQTNGTGETPAQTLGEKQVVTLRVSFVDGKGEFETGGMVVFVSELDYTLNFWVDRRGEI